MKVTDDKCVAYTKAGMNHPAARCKFMAQPKSFFCARHHKKGTETLIDNSLRQLTELSSHLKSIGSEEQYKANQAIHAIWKISGKT